MEKRRIFVEVTQDELLLLDLIKNAHDVDFHRFNDSIEIARAFTEQLGETKYNYSVDNTTEWYNSKREIDGVRVSVTSFLKEGEDDDE